MATGKAFDGKPYAGNPHVRFDEGEVAPAATPRRGSLLYNELTRKAMLALLLAASTVLPGRGAEPLTTLCTGTAPTISVPAAWTDGETVPGGTPLAVDAHSLTGDTVTVAVDGLAATFAGGGGT